MAEKMRAVYRFTESSDRHFKTEKEIRPQAPNNCISMCIHLFAFAWSPDLTPPRFPDAHEYHVKILMCN
jgi:hypothetical protein